MAGKMETYGLPKVPEEYSEDEFANLEKFKRARKRLLKMKERARANLHDKLFWFEGRLIDRLEMMDHIIAMAYENLTLPQILDAGEDPDMWPTPAEVSLWLQWHPGFKEQYDLAEKYRAEVLSNIGLQEVLNLRDIDVDSTKDLISKTKLIEEVTTRHAAFLNAKFQTKSHLTTENITQKFDEVEAKKQLAELMKSDPDLLKELQAHMGQDIIGIIEAEEEVPTEEPPQESEATQE